MLPSGEESSKKFEAAMLHLGSFLGLGLQRPESGLEYPVIAAGAAL